MDAIIDELRAELLALNPALRPGCASAVSQRTALALPHARVWTPLLTIGATRTPDGVERFTVTPFAFVDDELVVSASDDQIPLDAAAATRVMDRTRKLLGIAKGQEPRVSWRNVRDPQLREIARTVLRVAEALRGL